jgi:phospholipid transport system transporter-binding protein
MAIDANCHRNGDALVFAGALNRAAATALWPQASAMLDGVQRFVLTCVTTVDSAGLALLSELAARLRTRGATLGLEGEPPGLAELRAAYRLTDELV